MELKHHLESFTFYPTISILLIALLHSINGQAEMELVDSTDNSSTSFIQATTTPAPPQRTPIDFVICDPEDPLSNAYCTCKSKVVSCDFSSYPSTPSIGNASTNITSTPSNVNSSVPAPPATETELILYGYQFPPSTSRFCICNTPPNINLTFTKEHFLLIRNKIQRFDLYNLTGVTNFTGGFSLNFRGDLYIANVSLIPDITAYEFSHVDDGASIPKLQDLKCCSPIQVNQQHQKPLLLIENTTIGLIHTKGLGDNHLWKTLIMKSVKVKGLQRAGIMFDSYPGYNVAIMGSTFENIIDPEQFPALAFKDSANLLMFKNYFKKSTNYHSWWSKSELNNSNILLMDNVFWNGIYLDMDAQNVVSWFNIYNLWDNDTFYQMRYTSFPSKNVDGSIMIGSKRSVSFKYNLVNKAFHLNNSLDFGGSQVTFKENVIGSCDCSRFEGFMGGELIKPEVNYCYTGSIAKDRGIEGKCSVWLDKAEEECGKTEESLNANFSHFCKSRQASVPGFPGIGTNLTEDIEETMIKSKFISLIVHDFQSYFGVNTIKIGKIVYSEDESGTDINSNGHSQEDEHSGQAGSGESKSHSSTHSTKVTISPAVTVFITILVSGSITALAYFGYKHRHRWIRRSGGHEVLAGSQETFI